MYRRAGFLLLVTFLTSWATTCADAANHRLARSKHPAATSRGTPIEQRLSGTYPVAGAFFANWGRLVKLYDDQIEKVPQPDIVARWLTAGFADPRADIRELGMVIAPLDGPNRSAGMITGNAEVERILRAAGATGVRFERSVHRGVTLHTANVGRSVQVGTAGGNQLLFSVDEKDEHELQEQNIETLAGQRASYSATQSLVLPEDYIAHAGFQIRSIRIYLKYLGEVGEALQDASEVAGTLTVAHASADAPLALRFTMTGDDEAQRLEAVMRPWLEDLVKNAPPAYRELVRSITYDRQGKILKVTVAIKPGWVALLMSSWS